MGKKKNSKRKLAVVERGYNQVTALNSQNADWAVNPLTEDADVWQNQYILRSRIRDLYRTNPYFQKYREELWANVFGEHGTALRMKVKETEDRVVYAADEKYAIDLHEKRVNRVRAWVAHKTGRMLERLVMTRKQRGQATIKAGELDVFASQLIERRFSEWKRAEFCDFRGQRDYSELQQIRLLSAARDGGHFIRMIEDPKVNKFGFTLQQVNDEWCDYWLNATLDNGNVIRMGIEREMTVYGPGKPVAYWFIRQQPNDWQWASTGGFSFTQGVTHDRVPASSFIHYARYSDNDSTRPAPWGASIIPKSRQLDAYELAEVTAARVAACKMGWFYSDVVPEGGVFDQQVDPTKGGLMDAVPGGFHGLPWGVKFQAFDPNHPNGNFDEFRKGMLRSWCAGMPGANYNIIANDAEGVSYSTGRIFSLDDRELWKLIQRFDINRAERPIFERWLRMSLITGALPLPLAKFDKFNQPHFSGRRWAWVDPAKDAKANREQLLLGLTSRSRLCDDSGVDFDDVLFEIAEEEMLIEELGLNAISLSSIAGTNAPQQAQPAPTEEPAPVDKADE